MSRLLLVEVDLSSFNQDAGDMLDDYDDYGNFDCPDMGIHKYDGGLGDGSFL